MAKIEDCPGFETFGSDVKAARYYHFVIILKKRRTPAL